MKNLKEKSIKSSNGITLIALVITIIVLLILAGISISMLSGDNSILQKGTDAKQTSERAEAKEQAQIDIMTWITDKTANHQDASLDDEKVKEILSDNKSYVKEAKATSFITEKGGYEIPYSELYSANTEMVGNHDWTRNIDTFTCSHCNKSFQMGEILNYTVDGKISTTVSGTDSGIQNGITDNKVTASNFGTDGIQNITRENELIWVVLGIEDKDKNGTNETLLLTTATPITETVTLYGEAAFNNGVNIVKNVCEELYSNSSFGSARSITMEDINATFGWTETRGLYYGGMGNPMRVNTLETTVSELSIWNSLKDNHNTPDGTNTEEKLGSYIVDGYYYQTSDDGTSLSDPTGTNKTITSQERKIIFGSSNSYEYWVASRGVIATPRYSEVFFGLGYVDGNKAGSYIGLPDPSTGNEIIATYGLFSSKGEKLPYTLKLRPVIALTSAIPSTTGNIYD